MINKVVFILSDSDDLHQTHRIQEFIEHGFDVDVYAFNRKDVTHKNVIFHFEIKIIGEFYNKDSYRKRIPIIWNAIKHVANMYRAHKNVLFFYQGLSIALPAILLIRSPYIYEECDILQTGIKNKFVRFTLDLFDKFIVHKSLLTIFTSGGFLDYYNYEVKPNNVHIVTNRLHPSIIDLPNPAKRELNMSKLQVAFVGSMRYESIFNFTKVLLHNFPDFDFHLFGGMADEKFKTFLTYPNFHNHGVFRNPYDLPEIYSQLDLILCTYDNRDQNVLFAEPNKLYEAMYFKKPIIVSTNTFLEKKVRSLGIGYSVDPFDDDAIIQLLRSLTKDGILKVCACAGAIEVSECLNDNASFFDSLVYEINNCKYYEN